MNTYEITLTIATYVGKWSDDMTSYAFHYDCSTESVIADNIEGLKRAKEIMEETMNIIEPDHDRYYINSRQLETTLYRSENDNDIAHKTILWIRKSSK